MADFLHIQEPGQVKRPPPRLDAFLEMSFRPFYIAGCAWAAISIALWVFAPQILTGHLGGVMWHAHEMLWAFLATIAVGFLLTASATWTGVNPAHGRLLGLLAVLWLVARIGFLWPGLAAYYVAALAELLMYAVGAIALGRVIYKTHSKRNYGLPLLVLALGVADALFLWANHQGDYLLLLHYFGVGLLCMAVIALLVARRVVPFFATRGVPGLTIPMHTTSGQWQLAAGVLAIVFSLLGLAWAQAIALIVAGGIALVQLWAWKPLAVRKVPLLWILYIGYGGLGLGLVIAALNSIGWVARVAWPVHIIGVLGMSVLIIGMVTRTALGHLGRPLKTDASMVTSYVLVILAALLRLGALLPSSYTQIMLHASAAAWVVAFAVYLWRFVPLLIRPRLDKPAAKAKAGGINISVQKSQT